jgi:hypothetical protein
MSDVSSVVNFFSTANENFSANLSTGILASATEVPLNHTTALTDGAVFVGIIEPTGTKEQVFTGTVDLTNSQIKDVIWTRGTNTAHEAGVLVVDYVTGTDWNMLVTGILKFANQKGNLKPADLYDSNGNKIMSFSPTTSAVNRVQIDNSSTTNNPALEAVGSDTNIGLNFKTKGSDAGTTGGLMYNGVLFRARARDWVRNLNPITYTSTPVGSWSLLSGSGWTYPSGNPTWVNSDGTQHGEIRYKVYLDAGVYSFTSWFEEGTDKGIITWGTISESGSVTNLVSSVDTYNASVTDLSNAITGVSVASGGYYTFFFKADTKNASSSSYKVAFMGMQIWRTA